MNTPSRLRPIWLLCALVSAGCAATTSGGNPFAAPGEGGRGGGGEIHLLAQNAGSYEARLYALSGGDTQEIGVVGARNATSFDVNLSSSSGDLRIRVEPLAGMRHTTNTVLVRAGDIVDLYIPADPTKSSIRVR